MLERLRTILLALLVGVLAIAIGTAPASANPAGNYAQPYTTFNCNGYALQGQLAVHFAHDSLHRERAYGTYGQLTSKASGVVGVMWIDTEVRNAADSSDPWHYVDTYYPTSNTWATLFSNTAPNYQSGGRARWWIQYQLENYDTSGCWVAESPGALYGLP